jgi:hypothetical protein
MRVSREVMTEHAREGLVMADFVDLELFPLSWNQLSSLLGRVFDGEPDPLHRKML